MGLFTSFGYSLLPFHHRLLPKHLWPLLIICLPQARQVLTVSSRAGLGKIIQLYFPKHFLSVHLSSNTSHHHRCLGASKIFHCLEVFDLIHPSGFLAFHLLDSPGPMGLHLFLASPGNQYSNLSQDYVIKNVLV